jgi:hypothetical protein
MYLPVHDTNSETKILVHKCVDVLDHGIWYRPEDHELTDPFHHGDDDDADNNDCYKGS